MSETKQLIEQLNGRVDKLISRIAESNQQAEKKQAEIVSLTEQLRQKDLAIAALQEELTAVKQAQLAASSTENDELKGRINEMVREIDECISLLNVGN
jgi:chromosome segregation ATPase